MRFLKNESIINEVSERITMDQIQNRYDRADYLLESVADFGRDDELLWDIIGAMSDQEFHPIYNYICRMRDIEPDIDKFNERMALDMAQ